MTDTEFRKRLSRIQGRFMKLIADIESIKLMLPEVRT